MIRLLPRSPRGTWLLAGAVWLAGVGVLWWALPYRPRASWPTEVQPVVYGFIPGSSVLLTSSGVATSDLPEGPMRGPLVFRDVASGQVREWFGPDDQIPRVALAPDGRHVLIGHDRDRRTRLRPYDIKTGAAVAEVPLEDWHEEGERPILSRWGPPHVSFSPDRRRVAYSDSTPDGRVLRVWDVEAKCEVAVIHDARTPVAWSPDGESVAYAAYAGEPHPGTIHLRNLATDRSRALRAEPESKYAAWQLAFAPDGRTLVAALYPLTDDGRDQVVGWDTASGREKYRLDALIALFPSRFPWFSTQDNQPPGHPEVILRRDYGTGAECDRFVLQPSVGSAGNSFSPDGRLLFGTSNDSNPVRDLVNQYVLMRPGADRDASRAQLWDTGSGQRRYTLPVALNSEFLGAKWSSKGDMLTMWANGVLTVWDVPPRKSLWWFVAGAGLLAFPIVLLARWHSRRELAGVSRRG
jgi:WD40 repeat protein